MKEKEFVCSFCGKSKDKSTNLIAGPTGAYICEECIDYCAELLLDLKSDDISNEEINLLKPAQIKERLDEYIIGQDDAKKVLSVAVYNHYKRILLKPKKDVEDVEIDKSNILLLGPTGSGKTLLAKTLARILDVPFAIADATTLTEAGYVGEDVENILLKLIQNAKYDIKKAERGIVYIDEIDKIARKTENVSITRDVSGEGVQQALLKIIESTTASVPPQGGRKHPQQEMLKIDTTNILFILGGAFVGLDEIVAKRVGGTTLGFSGSVREKDDISYEFTKDVQPQDLIAYGLIPEFVGRVPVTVGLNPLDEDALVNIMTQPKNALIKQFKKLISYDNVELKITDEAVRLIAAKAIELKTGARGLRNILENLMLGVMYDLPTLNNVEAVEIDENVVLNNAKPNLVIKKSA